MTPFSLHRILVRTVLAGFFGFAWVIVFQIFFVQSGVLSAALTRTAAAYILCHVISILATPFMAARLRRGVRAMFTNALIALAAAAALLAASHAGFLPAGIAIPLFSVCMGLYRALYWIPYEVSVKYAHSFTVQDIVIAGIPALSGFALAMSALAQLYTFILAALLSLVAILPIYRMRDVHEGFSWGYRESFRRLFDSVHRVPLLQSILNGFEGAALLFLWPIFVFILVQGSFLLLGLVMTATLLCTMGVRLILKEHEVLRTPLVLSALTFSGWVLRGVVSIPFTITLVDTYYYSTSDSRSRGIDVTTMEQSADSNTYIDEVTALKEMGQGIGRLLFCFLLIGTLGYATLEVASLALFAVAGLAAVLSIVLVQRAGRRQ